MADFTKCDKCGAIITRDNSYCFEIDWSGGGEIALIQIDRDEFRYCKECGMEIWRDLKAGRDKVISETIT